MHFFESQEFIHLLSIYGYFLVFALIAMESLGVPMPGETILIATAVYAATTHNLNIVWIVVAAAAGAIIGDNIGFWIGRKAGAPFLAKFGPRIGFDEKRQKLGQYLFMKYGGLIVFIGRFVALLRAFAALLAGINRLDPKEFFLYNAAGGIVWASVFGFGAYKLGAAFHGIAGSAGKTLLILTLIAVFFFVRFIKKHEAQLIQKAEAEMNASQAAASRPSKSNLDEPKSDIFK